MMELVQEVITETAVKSVGDDLERKIRDRSAQLGVIGLGYVGLPLAVEMAQKGFRVTGIDIDGSKVESVNTKSYRRNNASLHSDNLSSLPTVFGLHCAGFFT